MSACPICGDPYCREEAGTVMSGLGRRLGKGRWTNEEYGDALADMAKALERRQRQEQAEALSEPLKADSEGRDTGQAPNGPQNRSQELA